MKSDRSLQVVDCTPEKLQGLAQLIRVPIEASLMPTEASAVQFFGELAVIACRGEFEIGICTYRRRPLEVDQMEQHVGTQELLVAIDDDFLMPIAPSRPRGVVAGSGSASPAGAAVPELSRLLAVRVRRGEGLVFGEGVWHWAPYPVRQESFALVGFRRGTAKNDMTVCRLEERITLCI